jgi:hypothetical protein
VDFSVMVSFLTGSHPQLSTFSLYQAKARSAGEETSWGFGCAVVLELPEPFSSPLFLSPSRTASSLYAGVVASKFDSKSRFSFVLDLRHPDFRQQDALPAPAAIFWFRSP